MVKDAESARYPHDPPHDQRINRAVSLLRTYINGDPNGPIQWNSAGQEIVLCANPYIRATFTFAPHTCISNNHIYTLTRQNTHVCLFLL